MEDIIYLTHFTNIDNVNNILNDFHLYTNIERVKYNTQYKSVCSPPNFNYQEKDFLNQFPGVYMSYVSKCDIHSKIKYVGNVCLCFTKKLLQQKNYHINITNNNGLISEHITYYPNNLNKIPKKEMIEKFYIKNEGVYCGNEVVFHDKINLGTLCEIWVKDSNLYHELRKKIPKKFHYLIHLKNIYIDDLLNQFNCKIDEHSKPFYLSIDYFRNGINKKLYNYENKSNSGKNHYLKMCKLISLNDNIINKFNLTDPQNLIQYLIKHEYFSKFHKNRNKQNIYYLTNNKYLKLKINYYLIILLTLFSLLIYYFY